MIKHRSILRSPTGLRPLLFRLFTFLVLFSVTIVSAACATQGGGSVSATEREGALRQIATEYAQTGDLKQAEAGLDKLKLANPGQLLVSLAEADLASGRAREEIQASARLAEVLGARSQRLVAYLAPTVAPAPTQDVVPAPTELVLAATVEVGSPVPASSTPVPTTAVPTETVAPATATEAASPTSSPTPEPQNPRVVAKSDVNLRGGPGTGYAVVARLRSGQEAPIIGRNASGDWWQVQVSGPKQAWVAGTVIRVLGAIDTVAVAKNIPVLPTAAPRPTAAPQPPAVVQPTAAPQPPAGPHFTMTVHRLWTVEETGGYLAGGLSVNCGYQHNLHVYVKDAAGNLLNGVTIREVGGGQQELVSGSKAPGMAEFDLYPPGKDVYVIRDVDGRQASSDTGAAPTDPSGISFDVLRGSRFCTDDADCVRFVGERGCYGHYSWDIEFRRNY